jgi:hypothetical protein
MTKARRHCQFVGWKGVVAWNSTFTRSSSSLSDVYPSVNFREHRQVSWLHCREEMDHNERSLLHTIDWRIVG